MKQSEPSLAVKLREDVMVSQVLVDKMLDPSSGWLGLVDLAFIPESKIEDF